ncbi:hypothetical protein PN441_04720 [Spirulina major CS-329]|nr:hypothetical protein [Spirulina major CS-329]
MNEIDDVPPFACTFCRFLPCVTVVVERVFAVFVADPHRLWGGIALSESFSEQ